jgi:hypothetical protein
MTAPIVIAQDSFDPAHMLDHLRYRYRLKNDASLCRMLDVKPPLLSKIRHRKRSVCPSLIIRIHEVTGIRVQDLRVMMGDRRARMRPPIRNGAPVNRVH